MNWAKIERDNKIIVFILFKEKNGNAHWNSLSPKNSPEITFYQLEICCLTLDE
jgi:hypothetical protein